MKKYEGVDAIQTEARTGSIATSTSIYTALFSDCQILIKKTCEFFSDRSGRSDKNDHNDLTYDLIIEPRAFSDRQVRERGEI